MVRSVDAIILGAGVAGLTAARALRLQGARVLVLESFAHVGGNHRSRNIGDYTFDIGSIVFNRQHDLFRYFKSIEPLCVPFHQRIQRIAPGGGIRDYPFEMKEAFGTNPIETLLNAASLIKGRSNLRPPKNVEDVCHHLLGQRLYENLGLKVYIERFYGLAPTEINLRFAEQRMQFIAKRAKFSQLARTLATAAVGRFFGKPHQDDIPFEGLVRPREGFEVMYGAAQVELAGQGVDFKFGVSPLAIHKQNQGFRIETQEGAFEATRVISTIPVNAALKLIGHAELPGLRSSDLLTLYVSFAGQRGFHAPILYNFDADGAWKRLTMHSDAYGAVDGREYFSLEFPFMTADISRADDLFALFKDHVSATGALVGDLRLEGADVTEKAYPAYTLDSDALLKTGLDVIEKFGIETVGRQGRFDYLPTVMHVMEQVEREMSLSDARRREAEAPSA